MEKGDEKMRLEFKAVLLLIKEMIKNGNSEEVLKVIEEIIKE